MRGGDVGAVAGDADEAHQPLRARLDQRLEGAARAERHVELGRLDQVVHLDQVDRVDAHALERAVQLLARVRLGALVGLGGEEEVAPVRAEPRREPQLRLAVARRRVDVVHPVAQEQLEHAVGALLLHAAQGGRAEQDPGALVARAAEGDLLDHRALTRGSTLVANSSIDFFRVSFGISEMYSQAKIHSTGSRRCSASS